MAVCPAVSSCTYRGWFVLLRFLKCYWEFLSVRIFFEDVVVAWWLMLSLWFMVGTILETDS